MGIEVTIGIVVAVVVVLIALLFASYIKAPTDKALDCIRT